MLKSILVTAFRNIFRNRTFSLINLIGLSVSMSVGLLILMVIREQFTFDNFHRDADRIYRVNTRALRAEGGTESYASTPYPLGGVLRDEFTFSEQIASINWYLNADAEYGNVNIPIRGLFVDPSFLEIFNFPFERGNPTKALAAPNNIVLTESAAEKIFGQRDPLGQMISIGGYGEFQVSGVLKQLVGKTHFDFEVLVSTSAMPLLEKNGALSPTIDNWNNYYGSFVYFKLKEGRQTKEVEEALAGISKKYYANLKMETRDKGYEFFLLRLDELTPGPILSNQMGKGMPFLLVVFMGVLVGLIMIMACFNYTNLMIAKSLSRAREIGIRKVIGAQRFQVFFQFVGEAVLFALIALVFSYLQLQVLKPAFLQLNIAREFSANLQEDLILYVYFILFAVGVGLIAGLLPAGYLSAFRPASVLKEVGNLKVYSRLTLRKSLIVTQFALSLTFIIFVLVIYKQVDYMLGKDYGFNDKNILNIRLQGMEFNKLANEMRSVPGVVSVGGVSHKLGTWEDRNSDYKRNAEDKPFVMRDFLVDDNYIDNLQLAFVAGKNFDPTTESSRESHVILNEKALLSFGFSDPVTALGKTIVADESLLLTVVGVVKDFHFRPMNYEIGPLALRYSANGLAVLSMRIAPGQKESVVAFLEPTWKKLDAVHQLDWKMMSDEIDDAYTDSGFLDVLKIVGYVSFLAVSLACLGMLGMAMYSTQTRIKEIGVRKVMGASSEEIVYLLSRSFLTLIGIAILLGAPLGYFLGDTFLQTYAYRIEISPWLILFGILSVVGLGVISIGSQTWKAAASNPVKSLRYE